MKYLLIGLFVFGSVNLFAQPKKGETVPDIALKDINGNTISLSSLRGKVVLLDFWASWCGPCRKANHKLAPLYPKLKAKGFEIYSISIDDDKEDWKKAIATDKITWLQVSEKGGWNGSVASAWNIQQIPATFLIDKNGKLVATDLEGRALESKINSLLKQ